MLEETNATNEISIQYCSKARFNACLNQCRIQKYIKGGNIEDGNCPCKMPSFCRFNLEKHLVYLNPKKFFPDVNEYYRQLYNGG